MHILVLAAFLLLIGSATTWADDPKGEFSFLLGWTFSDGVTGDGVLALDGNIYDSVDPKDSFSWGLSGEFFVTPNVEVGFLYDRQKSKLEIGGTNTVEVGDMNVDDYLGTFTYNWGESDATTRPFVMGGIGATHYGAVNFTGFDGVARETPTQTKFAGSIGGGLKLYPSKAFGVRLQARWTPTYIKTDSAGWWCDPYWGCYVVGNAQYSNQFEMGAGINIRF